MTQETHYCSICGRSNHEVSDIAVMGEMKICSVCVSIAAGSFLVRGSADFKRNVELLLSVSSSSGVKAAGIDAQAEALVEAIESVHRQYCGMDGEVDSQQILKQRKRELDAFGKFNDDAKPYALSEKSVLDMWLGVKLQAQNQIDFLFVNHDAEDKKGALSKWIVVVFEDQVHFSRFENGAKLESYAPVPVSKAAVYAAAIVNGLQPPRDLRQCDKPIG